MENFTEVNEVIDFIESNHELSQLPIIDRKERLAVRVGDIVVGGGNSIVIQSMTLNPPSKAKDCAAEVMDLINAGSEFVRLAVACEEDAKCFPIVRDILVARGYPANRLVICGQYEVEKLMRKYPEMADAACKCRINPGNIGFGEKRDDKFKSVIEAVIKHNLCLRIGVNWGSCDKYLLQELMDRNAALPASQQQDADTVLRKALVLSVMISAMTAEKIGLSPNKIIISCKVSRVQDLVAVHRALARVCKYPIHLGLTEAGMGPKGIVATTAGLSILLQEGIGDTIRASLTPRPGESRANEVKVCQLILQSMGLRSFAPTVTSCPGCGRTESDRFRELADEVNKFLERSLIEWKKCYIGVEDITVAVMGCVVNGPGESKHANIGISLPGVGEAPVAAVYQDGQKLTTLRGDNILEEFKLLIQKYVVSHCVPIAAKNDAEESADA